jgi:hypothetical protein
MLSRRFDGITRTISRGVPVLWEPDAQRSKDDWVANSSRPIVGFYVCVSMLVVILAIVFFATR